MTPLGLPMAAPSFTPTRPRRPSTWWMATAAIQENSLPFREYRSSPDGRPTENLLGLRFSIQRKQRFRCGNRMRPAAVPHECFPVGIVRAARGPVIGLATDAIFSSPQCKEAPGIFGRSAIRRTFFGRTAASRYSSPKGRLITICRHPAATAKRSMRLEASRAAS